MYQVRTDDEIREAVLALSAAALAGYGGVLDVLELTPWNGAPINDANPDAEVRQLVFGPDGKGIVT